MFKRIIKELAEELIEDWDNEESRNKAQERFLDPIVCYLIDKMYPYFIVSSTVVFILVFLMVMILFLLLRK
jgi:hypothetical protein